MNICCAISLAQYLLDIQYRTLNPIGNTVRQGIVDGRLFGIFSDPNFAAFYFLFSADAACIHFLLPKNRILRIYIGISAVLNIAYIVFSNSRTVFLCVIGTVFFFVLLLTYRRYIADGRTSVKRFLSLCNTKPCAFFGWNDCCLFSALLSDAEYRQTDGKPEICCHESRLGGFSRVAAGELFASIAAGPQCPRNQNRQRA